MALVKVMFLVCLAMAAPWAGDAKVFKDEIEDGIPENYPCAGPSTQELARANTKMMCGGNLCLVHCKDGYIPAEKIPFVYICHANGYWTVLPYEDTTAGYRLNWPSCVYDKIF